MTADRAAAFLADILRQPAMLAALLDAYGEPGGPLATLPRWAPDRGRRVALVGLGSSRYAALDAAAALRARGIAAWAEFAAPDAMVPPATDLVVVAISASGRTAEVVDVVERHRGRSFVIGVTNRPDEPVGRGADVVLPLMAGDERAGISCLTYLATRAVLSLLSECLTGGVPGVAPLRPAIEGLESLANGRSSWLEPAADLLDRAPAIGVVAPVGRLGTAEQAALMFREAPRLPAVAHETGDWSHTAIYTALPGHRVVLLAGSPADPAVVRTVRDRGGRVIAIGDAADADGVVSLMQGHPSSDVVASLAVDLLAATLWARTDASESAPD